MNFLHRLQALLDPPVQAYTDPTGRPMQSATGGTEIEPTADDRAVFAAMAFLADNPGVLTPQTPGMPVPARPEGEPQ